MRVLITGGAGFIGSHLCDLHLAQGDQVHVVDDLSTGRISNLEQHADNPLFTMDVEDVSLWAGIGSAVARADRVYHLAAIVGVRRVLQDPLRTMEVNSKATRRVLEAAEQAEQPPTILIASSSEVYGFNRHSQFRENGSLVMHSGNYDRWCYALAKMSDEAMASIISKRSGLATVTVRLFNTIGPRQLGNYGMVLPNFVRQAVANTPLTVFGDGNQIRSFVDVRDTVRALKLLLDEPRASGRIVNVGQEQQITIEDLAKLVIARADSQSSILKLSYKAAYGASYRDIGHRSPRLRLLRALTGFKHEWSLERSIDELIANERQRHAQPLVVEGVRRARHAA